MALITQNASTSFKDKVQCLRCHAKIKVKVSSPKNFVILGIIYDMCDTCFMDYFAHKTQWGNLISNPGQRSIKFGLSQAKVKSAVRKNFEAD